MYLKNKKCLFIGHPCCDFTNECLDILDTFEMNVTCVFSKRENLSIPKRILNWQGDFIFSYRNFWLLNKAVLSSAKIMAINFHPGTPNFAGSGSFSWAVYENADKFGVTIHLMDEKFDSGKILKVYEFKIKKDTLVEDLIKITRKKSVFAFKKFIGFLNNQNTTKITKFLAKNSRYNWTAKPKKLIELKQMQKLDIKFSNQEVQKRINAFNFKDYPVYYELNGKKFYYNNK